MTRELGSLAVLSLLAMLLGGAGAPRHELVTLPGQTNSVTSPDGRYTLRNVDNMAPSPTWSHRIWLDDHRTGKKTMIFEYGRWAQAAWASSGTLFFVNDHWASDRSDCRIGDAAKARFITALAQRLQKTYPEVRRLAEDHAYFDCVGWLTPDTVKIRFHGHLEHLGFERFYSFRVGHGFKRLGPQGGED